MNDMIRVTDKIIFNR